jgi:putative sugar O-methyltransferase
MIARAIGLTSAEIFSELGLLFHLSGKIDQATRCYELAVERAWQLDTIHRLAVLYFAKGRYAEALSMMQVGVDKYGLDNSLRPQLARMLYVSRQKLDLTTPNQQKAFFHQITQVEAELQKNPLYQPSVFWEKHIRMHKYLLEVYGVENFKRTVSHNYQNWLMISMDDPQVRVLQELHPEYFLEKNQTIPSEDVTDVGFHWVILPVRHREKKLRFNFVDVVQDGVVKTEVLFPEYPLSNPESLRVYTSAVRALWESSGIETSLFNDIIREEEIGNPIRITHKNKLISSDLAHSFREKHEMFSAARLEGSEALCVAELGAGHGRLAELLGKTTNFRYIIFDISPALCVSQWYISQLFGEQNVFKFRPFVSFDSIKSELSTARFAFFSANQIELFPNNYFDMFVNINSLMEMKLDQIKNFLFHIDRVTKSIFYLKQWKKWTNEMDRVVTEQSHYTMNPPWQLALKKTDEIYKDFFVEVWLKNEFK